MKRYVNKILPENVKVQTVFTGKRLSNCFKTEDRTKFEHQHDIIYQMKCSAENWLKDHGGRDTKSHVLRHSSEKEHVEVTQEDFKVIGSHFKNNRIKKKIAEAL